MKNNLYSYFSYTLFTLLMLVLYSKVQAQDTIRNSKGMNADSEIQQQLENLAEDNNSEDADYSDILEGMSYYKEHPIDINHTTKEELSKILFLNDIQINNLLSHIENTGKLITIYELQSIDGFDLQTINKILPYIKVTDNFTSPHFTLKEMLDNGQSILLFRYGRVLEKQVGFKDIDSASLYKSPNSRYIGSPDKLYARYRFNYGTNISIGITAEKDQGELFFKNKQRFKYDWYNQSLKGKQHSGFDFYSAHLFLHNIKFIKALALGDYQVTFGQGLTAWSSYTFGKGINILNVKKSASGIHPYTSVDENKFMRGVATTLVYKRFEATGFYSRKHVDANVTDTLSNGDVQAISSLEVTGYHTTPAEIADKHSILQTIYGGNVSYKGKKLSLGATAVSYNLDADYNRSLTYYNQFEFSAKHNFNVGVDYNYILRNVNLFGEEAIGANGGKAFVNGALISLDSRLFFTFLHRYYERNYQNLLSAGFSEGTANANEKGVYAGVVIKPSRVITVAAYYDRFEFPWMKYLVNGPSKGNDFMAQINYTPSKKTDMYFRIRQRNKEKNSIATDNNIAYPTPVSQTNYRFDLVCLILPAVRLKNRVEIVDYKLQGSAPEKGYLIIQDIVYNKIGKPFSVSLGYAVFQTDSYNSRIYSYENDIPGSYSIPSYFYRGTRFYTMFDYNITRRIEVWIRYSQTYYDNQNVISAGSLAEIDGNTKSEVRALIKIKF